MRGTGESLLGKVLLLGNGEEERPFSLAADNGLSWESTELSDLISGVGVGEVVRGKFCNLRPPRFGREKFSVVAGSDCTFVKG